MEGPNKKIFLLSLGGLVVIVLAGLYLGRNNILNHVVRQRIECLEQKYGLSVSYENLKLKGLSTVSLQNLSVVPQQRDTLLTLQSLDAQLSLPKLLKKTIEIEYLDVDGLRCSFVKQDSIANYDFLFLKRENADTISSEKNEKVDYAKRLDRLFNLLYGFLPENGQLNHVYIREQKDSSFVSIRVPGFRIEDNRFHSDIQVEEDTLSQQWTARGELNRHGNILKAELYTPGAQKVVLPYLTRRFGAKVTFDTLSYSLVKEKLSAHQIRLKGKARISGLDVYHKALSSETIHLDRGQVAYQINICENILELDSATNVIFNKLQFHPYLKAGKEKGYWHFTVAVDKPWFPAENLFGSLPKGLFSNLEGIKTSGELAYHFLLDIDSGLLDSLKLESELKEKDFRILKYGATDLGKMSEEFIYTAYEKGQPVRSFAVGPSWEHFTPLHEISPLLQMSVMQSEDGAFYYHHGFLPDAMREALIHDLKVKRFARGGSTITMQLVKNVFLNRNKNFARKLEEALIVWLIETEKLTSKERMYEVYLNIAEWGPLVYGAHEAAAYYFNKRPSELTAEESIFLASIIPKPKHFRNSFDENGKLKENLEGYYRLIAERLAKKGLINEVEAENIRPDIQITGEARNRLDSLANITKEKE